jgi:hypothetical protein
MRIFMRLAVLGILVVSCRENIIAPTYDPGPEYVCQPTVLDTMFGVYTDSMRLVMGSADGVYVEWGAGDGCQYDVFPGSGITWTILDTTIAVDVLPPGASPDDHYRYIVPRAPGRTTLVVEAGAFSDSVLVSVPDTTIMGPAAFVTAGSDVSCAVSEAGVASCWGYGSFILGEWGVDPAVGNCLGAPCSPFPIARAVSGREHDDGDVACFGFFAQCHHQLEARHAGHVVVREHQIEGSPFGFFEAVSSVDGGGDRESLSPQAVAHQVADGRGVIDYEHCFALGAHARCEQRM